MAATSVKRSIHHFRNVKETGPSGGTPHWRHTTVFSYSVLANFLALSLVTVPEVFVKVNSAEFTYCF